MYWLWRYSWALWSPHVNCRHTFHSWYPGINIDREPQIDPDENKKRYEAEQKARAKERAIRNTRRQIVAKQVEMDALPKDAAEYQQVQKQFDELSFKLQGQQADYNKFIKENKLSNNADRLETVGFKENVSRVESGARRQSLRIIDGDNALELYRRKYNTGAYEIYSELMSLQHVKRIVEEMNLSEISIKYKIVRDEELIGKGLLGHITDDAKMIELYPDSFSSRETLVKTIGHEHIHLQQILKGGKVESTEELIEREKETYASEEGWWKDYVKKTKYRQ